jgi:hypothetical protein
MSLGVCNGKAEVGLPASPISSHGLTRRAYSVAACEWDCRILAQSLSQQSRFARHALKLGIREGLVELHSRGTATGAFRR